MMKCFALALAVLSLALGVAHAATFAKKPTATRDGNSVKIAFAVDKATDVAVTIVDAKGMAVRHLAAGVLGPNAPAPFKAGPLSQTLVWDGTDDGGKPVPAGKYIVRVGLGTTAKFDRNIGQNRQWLGNIYAMVVGKKGEVYVLCSRGICVLDREGKYQRQIVPGPKSLSPDALSGREPVTLKDGTVYFKKGYNLPGGIVGQMALTPDGRLVIPGPSRYARKITIIGTDGSVRTDAFSKKLTTHADDGYLYLTSTPDGQAVYMAGAMAGYRGDDARKLSYRQAVYKLPLDADGPAEIFTGDDENRGGPSFSVSEPKGLTCDAKGNLYVCNYRGGNVAVYSPGGGVLKSIKVKWPHQVAVHPKTGQVYVLAGYQQGRYKYGYNYPARMRAARIHRFSAAGKEELMLELPPAWVKKRKEGTHAEFNLRMAVGFTGAKPIVWVGVAYPGAQWSKWNLKRIVDQGAKFGEPKEITPKPTEHEFGFSPRHLVLDRKNDILYFNGNNKLIRFTGDGKRIMPSVKPVDPKTGKRYSIAEAAVGPDGLLYATAWQAYGYRNSSIIRFDTNGKLVPFAGGVFELRAGHVMKGGGGRSSRGFTVDPKGNIYVMHYDHKFDKSKLQPWDRSWGLHTAVTKFGPDGKLLNAQLIGHLRAGAQCVRVDRAGSVYIGDNVMPVGVTMPSDFAGPLPDPLKRSRPAMLKTGAFDPLLRHMGSVFKFSARGGSMAGLPAGKNYPKAKRPAGDLWKPVPQTQWFMFHNHRLLVKGALWQFHGMSPVPAQYQGVTHVERCVCLGGRFDLDEFGRVFVPDQMRHRVTVLDGAGNVVTRFGERDNQDSNGPHIGLAGPGWVAAAADRVYVSGAGRVVKVRLVHAVTETCAVMLR
jgi:SMP-30/gluconolaconase/LRE-like protein